MPNRRSNGGVLLNALMSGHRVEYRGTVYKLIQAGEDIVCPSGVYTSDSEVLVTMATMISNNVSSEVALPSDLSINDVFRMTANMTEEERFGIISSHVLHSVTKQR